MRVLVTDSDTRPALATVRALGRAGYQVIVAGDHHPSLASVSRYCGAVEYYPAPASDPDGFVNELVDIAERQQVDLLLPMTEITTLLLAEHRNRLPASCRLPFPTNQVIADASNKALVVQLAASLGVPTPRTVIVQSAAEAAKVASSLPCPTVIKPARSRVRTGSTWLSNGVSYAANAVQLAAILTKMPPAAYPVLLQERIEGPGRGLFACFDRGRPVALFSHRRLREKPPSGGVSVLSESVPLDPLAVEYATRLLTRLGWHGVAMVEFKQDLRDGSLHLMEINARFWGSLQLAIDAGVNFPRILADVAIGKPPAAAPNYRIGVQSRWLTGDLDALLMVLTRSRHSLSLPPSQPGRLDTFWRFLHLRGRDLHYEIERLDDRGPMRLEWRRYFFGR